ncbi:hypothetical protein B0H14DRAFT_2595498 [Mycena olivaceomarginata]|nr:hypothetical protein B0H14DRAFT_2595498 [Mycena olivaceomarginata]
MAQVLCTCTICLPDTSSITTVLDLVKKEWMDSLKMPKKYETEFHNLCIFSTATTSAKNTVQQWGQWDVLESLASYHSIMKLLFGVLNDMLHSTQLQDLLGHFAADKTSQCLSQDPYDPEEQLVTIFRDSKSYKSFLACHGDLAQRLLDLLQDLLDSFPKSSARPQLSKALERLSCASGLHPTCFPLTGLQKVGQQVAAGGFSDI